MFEPVAWKICQMLTHTVNYSTSKHQQLNQEFRFMRFSLFSYIINTFSFSFINCFCWSLNKYTRRLWNSFDIIDLRCSIHLRKNRWTNVMVAVEYLVSVDMWRNTCYNFNYLFRRLQPSRKFSNSNCIRYNWSATKFI